MYDLLLKKAKLFGQSQGVFDVGIKGEKIACVGCELDEDAGWVVELDGKLVIPGFVDLHTHLEKTLTAHLVHNNSGTLEEAIGNFQEFLLGISPEDIYKRARRAAEMAISQGTTAIRSHITVDPRIGLETIRSVLTVKRDLQKVVNIQVVAFPAQDPTGIKQEQLDLLRQAVSEGADLIGGCPTLDADYRRFTDLLFKLGTELDVDIDFHVDETDEPNVEALEYLAEKTITQEYQGRVTAGHLCSLSAVSDEVAERVIRKVREAELNVVTLPSANLFLMGRGDKQPIRRGVTRVRDLVEGGVSVSYASDNVRDPFRPFGNADLLEEALLTAQIVQMGSPAELERILAMGTYNPAKAMKLPGYGLTSGCYADMVVLSATSPHEAIVSQAVKEMVFHRGKLIVTNSRQTQELWKGIQ